MVRAVVVLAAFVLAGCGGDTPKRLTAAPLTVASWKESGDDCICPGASTRHDCTNSGVHVVFCTWACGTYRATMPGVPNADHDIVILEMGYMPDGWQLLSEDVQTPGICL
jgi:hypothetical protein